MRILRLAAALWMAVAVRANLYGQASVLTWHNDNFRTGQNLQETALTPVSVNASTFGRLFTIGVDGKVDAQPLYVPGLAIPSQGLHNVLFVETEHDSVYAFDADTGTQLWHVSMLLTGEVPSDDRGCGQVTPEIGVTSTPVIDLQAGPHGTMYVVAMSKNGSTYHQRLHALDLTTGGEQFSGPMEVQATYPGTGDGSVGGLLTFDPKKYKERAGLLIYNGVVYTSWASHCDAFPYTAWVIGYNELTLSRVSVLNLTPNGSDGSVWAAGAGPAADANGNIFLLMANGTFDTTLNGGGFPVNGDYGNAFVKIATGGTSVADYFTMFNTVSESNADADLGSGGAMLLPPVNDALGHPRDLAVGAGKDSNIYVVDRANMGKFNTSSNAIYQELPTAVGSVFSSPAWFNGTLYYGGVGNRLKAFAFASGMFSSNPTQTTNSFGYPGTTPSISANGVANGIVWAAENTNPAVLHAYDAGNLATELYNSNIAANNRDHFGAGNKFIVPTVVNGKVYVGTTNGVGVFGLFCGCTILPTNMSFTVAGGSGTVSVTTQAGCSWTATSNNGFISITSGPGGTGNGMVSYTVTANSGAARSGTLTIAGQTFTVTQAGSASCSYSISPGGAIATSAGGPGMVNVMASSGCPWTAVSNANFLSVTGGASGSGDGVVSYNVTANAGPDRSGTLTIAGQTFTLTQPVLPLQTWVSSNGADTNACDRSTPCKTFAGAIVKTTAGGEINCLDPGEFGTLTITKGITINCGGGDGAFSGSVQASGTDGFVVQAPANAAVTLRNIIFQGNSGSGLNAIRFLSGGYLHIQHVHVLGFSQNGIDVNNPAFAIATVRNSVMGDIGMAGVNVVYPASGAVSLDNIQISNAATGVHAGTNAKVMLTRTTIMGTQGGTSIGVKADTGGAAINIDSTLIAFCSTGVSASGGGNVFLANSSINNNVTGVSGNVSNSSPLSNTFFNNTSNGVFGGGAVILK